MQLSPARSSTGFGSTPSPFLQVLNAAESCAVRCACPRSIVNHRPAASGRREEPLSPDWRTLSCLPSPASPSLQAGASPPSLSLPLSLSGMCALPSRCSLEHKNGKREREGKKVAITTGEIPGLFHTQLSAITPQSLHPLHCAPSPLLFSPSSLPLWRFLDTRKRHCVCSHEGTPQ